MGELESKKIKFIREMLDDPATIHGRYFMLTIQALIIVSIISFTLETFPNKSENYYHILRMAEVVIVILFTIEYSLRLAFSKNKIKFALSFYGVVDVLSIAPFYLAMFVGLNADAFRVLRMLRMLRLFKLFRYGKSLSRFSKAYSMAKDDLVMFGAAAIIIVYIAGAGIYFFESEAQPDEFTSVLDGVWWAVVTLTTVGYGDTFPITAMGKIFTFLILIVGLAVVSIPTALIASALTEVRSEEDDD